MPEMRYTCMNPQKYAGDPRRIVARSSWELVYMKALDTSDLVTKWISEPKNLGISYLYPIDRKIHQYWPDFLIQYVDGSVEIVEIKPMKETVVEAKSSVYDKVMIIKNAAKWAAARRFAETIGAKFRVVTELQLFGKARKVNTYKPKKRK